MAAWMRPTTSVWRKNPAGSVISTATTIGEPITGQPAAAQKDGLPAVRQLGEHAAEDQGDGELRQSYTGLTPSIGSRLQDRLVSDVSVQVPEDNMQVRANAAGEIDLNFYELDGASWSDGWSPDTHRVGYEDIQRVRLGDHGQFNGWSGVNDPTTH